MEISEWPVNGGNINKRQQNEAVLLLFFVLTPDIKISPLRP